MGHRPVINGLILSTGSGDITQNTTSLTVGDTIRRTAGTISDVDGDSVEAGEYCVWYRVDPNTLVETLVKDPGTTDRNCEYMLQAADVGFRIKNVMKVFSDSAIAHDFKVNPADSWPVESMSANEVLPIVVPFPATTNLNTHVNPYTFSLNSGFPSVAFESASFTIQVEGNASNNSQYDWSTNQPAWTSVDANGIVRFTAKPSSVAKTVAIRATSKVDKSIVYSKEFTLSQWWTGGRTGPYMNNYCTTPRRQPNESELGGVFNGLNSYTSRGSYHLGLWSTWGNPENYGANNVFPAGTDAYWSTTRGSVGGLQRNVVFSTGQLREIRSSYFLGILCIENI
ncbi:hypothetical protein CUK74_12595 [Salmonella enterica]|nr:hypothetical protein [Salmonella enterica]